MNVFRKLWYVYTMEYYSAIKKNTFESVLKRWMKPSLLHRVKLARKKNTNTVSVQLLSRVQLFAIPWTVAFQASLFITNSWNLLKLMSIKSVMPSNHLILSRPLLLLMSVFPSIRLFSSESILPIRWPKVELQLQQCFQ